MLKKWIIGNFKSIGSSIELDIAPLTLLVGPNSSGKSTVIQSILLLTQTLASRRIDPQLVLNGEFVRLGSLGDVLHVRRDPIRSRIVKNPYLTIGFELEQTSGERRLPFLSEYQPTKVRVITKLSRRQISSDYPNERQPFVSRFDMNVQFITMEQDREGGEHPHPSSCSIRLTHRAEISGVSAKLLEDRKLVRENLMFRPVMSGDFSGAQPGVTSVGRLVEFLDMVLILFQHDGKWLTWYR